MKVLVTDEKIANTIQAIRPASFTVLDFMDIFKALHPAEWQRLIDRFGQFGDKRRYTATTYLSNRLDVYSRKPHSLLLPFTRYSEAKFKDYRRPTREERQRFGSPWIAVFKKRQRRSRKSR